MLATMRQALREKRVAAATQSAAALLDSNSDLKKLARIFAEAQQIEPLVQLIWDRRETLLRRFSAIATFLQLCDSLGDSRARIREFRPWLFADSTPPASFWFLDFLHLLKDPHDRPLPQSGPGSQVLKDLFFLKYRGWRKQPFRANVAALAERCEIPLAPAQTYYSCWSPHGISFSTWLHDFKFAQAMGHALKEARVANSMLRGTIGGERRFLSGFCSSTDLAKHVDMNQTRTFFNQIDTSRGLVLCTFHGVFAFILRHLYEQFMPDHCTLDRGQTDGRALPEKQDNRRVAAFRAVKALMQKKALLIAPDGPHMEKSNGEEIKIFGLPRRISLSAALFAYETRSDVGWCNLAYQNERFVPAYFPGPAHKQGETFSQFKDRWLSFYAGRIEAVLSSNPENLALHAFRSLNSEAGAPAATDECPVHDGGSP